VTYTADWLIGLSGCWVEWLIGLSDLYGSLAYRAEWL